MSESLRDTLKLRDANVRRYFPDVLANAKEFIAYADVIEPELNALIQKSLGHMLNTFVYDIDEIGATRWEEMLSLPRLSGAGLTARRERILARLNLSLPYTIRTFQAMLNEVYGTDVVRAVEDTNRYELWLDVARNVLHKSIAARRFARAIIPANLDIKVSSTKDYNMELYTGGFVLISKSTKIIAARAASYDIAPSTVGVGGIIKRQKQITIRSGD